MNHGLVPAAFDFVPAHGIAPFVASIINIPLNDIPQIDSSGISVLVKLSISLARQGGALHLVCSPGRVRDALTVTRLVEAIPTFETEDQAKANF
jgi:anti-anti-sigma factor